MVNLFQQFLQIILHLDVHLNEWTNMFGPWVYLILFLIIFCETGLVVMPFLPGDSLLFAVGALCSLPDNALNVHVCVVLLSIAGILGNSVNYLVGKYLGPKIFFSEKSKILNKRHLDRTHAFYEKYGTKTIVITRFIPILRTLSPFVAGLAKMNYGKFLFYNVVGALLWVGLFTYAGYVFGNIPVIKRNFTVVVLAIIFLSLIPAVIEGYKMKTQHKV